MAPTIFRWFANVAQPILQLGQVERLVPRYLLLRALLAMQQLFFPNQLHLEVIDALGGPQLNLLRSLWPRLTDHQLIEKVATYRKLQVGHRCELVAQLQLVLEQQHVV